MDWLKYKQDILKKLEWKDIYGNIKNVKQSGEDSMIGLCCFHEDHDPSFLFNVDKNSKNYLKFKCLGCSNGGSCFDFLAQTTGSDFKSILYDLGDKLGIPRDIQKPPIQDEFIERLHKTLLKNEKLMHYLVDSRGLTIATIKKYKIGWESELRRRYSIPVLDKNGKCVNIRFYDPKAKGKDKILNYRVNKEVGYGKPARLYGIDELEKSKNNQVILCEGEWDKILTTQNGFLCVTGTGGCQTFRQEWVKEFEGKDVVIIFDCDKAGKKAVEETILPIFKNGKQHSIKNVVLPLSGSEDEKDLTDYFRTKNYTAEDLQSLIDSTPVHSYKEEKSEEEIIELDSFVEIERKDLIDKKIKCNIVICGETNETFHAVEEFAVIHCHKRDEGKCSQCLEPKKVPISAQEYIGAAMSNNTQIMTMLRDYCCKKGQKPILEILKKAVVKEFHCHQIINRLVQQTIINEDTQEKEVKTYTDGTEQGIMEKRVYYISSERILPGNYSATGYVKTHPKTQQVTFLIESLVSIDDDFQAFSIEEHIDSLKALKKMTIWEIKDDIRDYVTRIYERDEILISMLLTYCSPLHIPFNKAIIRGWLSMVLIGDSGTGKSQTAKAISDYINVGDIFSGETGTRTGLTYAIVEHPSQGWLIRIGRFPANTRKLLIVDEVQKITMEDMGTMGKAMDEGFMQIDRVSSKGYESKTRLIMIGNPKGGGVMDNFEFGASVLKAIFPVTVIRRIDFAVFANEHDIKDKELDKVFKKALPGQGKITPEMLKTLVFWAWKMKPENIKISDETEIFCLEEAKRLTERFGHASDLLLVTRYDSAKTVIRIATAFAVLDVSTDDNITKLIVKPEHVKKASDFLDRIYSHDNCMLDEYSDTSKKRTELTDYKEIENDFLKRINQEIHSPLGRGVHTFSRLLTTIYSSGIDKDAKRSSIRRRELADAVGCKPEYISKLIKVLLRYNLIASDKDGYMKLPKFVQFLRRFMRDNKELFDKLKIEDAEEPIRDEEDDGGALYKDLY